MFVHERGLLPVGMAVVKDWVFRKMWTCACRYRGVYIYKDVDEVCLSVGIQRVPARGGILDTDGGISAKVIVCAVSLFSH